MSTTVQPVRYWQGSPPPACDMCAKPITTTFIDGATTRGPWANMCLHCHRVHGVAVRPGAGQMYRRQDDGRWLKVES